MDDHKLESNNVESGIAHNGNWREPTNLANIEVELTKSLEYIGNVEVEGMSTLTQKTPAARSRTWKVLDNSSTPNNSLVDTASAAMKGEVTDNNQITGDVTDNNQSTGEVTDNNQDHDEGFYEYENELSTPRRLDRIDSGVRGKPGTPLPTNGQLPTTPRQRSSNSTYREVIFQDAVHLMSQRCDSQPSSHISTVLRHVRDRYNTERDRHTSKDQTVAIAVRKEGTRTPLVRKTIAPYGPPTTEEIYVIQKRPTPMPPLKAWKGYNGNVYFSPINISKTNYVSSSSLQSSSQYSETFQKMLHHDRNGLISSSFTSTRSNGSRPSKEVRSSRANTSRTQNKYHMLVLDKRAVLNESNPSLKEDVDAIVRFENSGSLRMTPFDTTREGVSSSGTEKIRKGRVRFHNNHIVTYRNGLSVIGAQVYPPQSVYQGYRSSTERFSASSSSHLRTTTPVTEHDPNAPRTAGLSVPFLGASGHSLASDSSREEKLGRQVLEKRRMESLASIRMKPFVKYSPEFRQYLNKSFRPAEATLK